MQRLIEYVSRCPFSLDRKVTLNADGRIVYRASKGKCFPFHKTAAKRSLVWPGSLIQVPLVT
jgi:hypothetical protein